MRRLKLAYEGAEVEAEHTNHPAFLYHFEIKWRGAECWAESANLDHVEQQLCVAISETLGPLHLPMLPVVCLYCNMPAKLITGAERYPHRDDLKRAKLYLCGPCDASVGCHEHTNKPKGTLANKDLRTRRMKVHYLLDPLWKNDKMKRKEAYSLLAKELGIPTDECHVALFDIERCNAAIKVLTGLTDKILGVP